MGNQFVRLFLTITLAVVGGISIVQAEVTGASCKTHLKRAVIPNDLALEISRHYGSPQTTQLRFYKLRDGMNLRVRNYIFTARNVLKQCEKYCGGLPNFNCSALQKGTPKQIHLFTKNDDHMADSLRPATAANEAPESAAEEAAADKALAAQLTNEDTVMAQTVASGDVPTKEQCKYDRTSELCHQYYSDEPQIQPNLPPIITPIAVDDCDYETAADNPACYQPEPITSEI